MKFIIAILVNWCLLSSNVFAESFLGQWNNIKNIYMTNEWGRSVCVERISNADTVQMLMLRFQKALGELSPSKEYIPIYVEVGIATTPVFPKNEGKDGVNFGIVLTPSEWVKIWGNLLNVEITISDHGVLVHAKRTMYTEGIDARSPGRVAQTPSLMVQKLIRDKDAAEGASVSDLETRK